MPVDREFFIVARFAGTGGSSGEGAIKHVAGGGSSPNWKFASGGLGADYGH